MQASPVLRLLAFVLALSTFGSATLAHAQETFVYRDGLDGYAGTRSVNISSLGLADTGFGMNGTTFTDGGDWCIGDLPDTMGYDISPLLRFEGSRLSRAIAWRARRSGCGWCGGRRAHRAWWCAIWPCPGTRAHPMARAWVWGGGRARRGAMERAGRGG